MIIDGKGERPTNGGGIIEGGIDKIVGIKKFCTPGHKGLLLERDVTESDYFPLDYVQKAERRVAEILKVKRLRFLTGGSSIGIKAALIGDGDILAPRNCHQAIKEAALLGGQNLYFIENGERDGLILPPSKEQVEAAIKKYPKAQTVVLTSPDYYGLTVSNEAAKAVKSAGKTLFVDGAHGAHFLFREDIFDCEAFRLCDAFNLSAHKTLPALTQTAYLCVNNEELVERIDRNLTLLGTTSPFYPFLEGLEAAAEYTFENRAKYDELFAAVKDFKKEIPCAANGDFTRLVVDAHAMGLSGKQLYHSLYKKGILAEKYDGRYVIFIVSVCDSPLDVAELKKEIKLCKTTAN